MKQFAVVSATQTFPISLFTFPSLFVFYIYMAENVKGNVMEAAAFTDCAYIPFADGICSLPGPVNITAVEEKNNAGSGIKKNPIVYHLHSVQHYHPTECIVCIFFFKQGEWF